MEHEPSDELEPSTLGAPACDAALPAGDDDGSSRVVVATVIRPLLPHESAEGATEAAFATAGEPQVTLSSGHAFTFDHVYSGGDVAAALFDDCVRPLVAGLLSGFNATVLAYGQTGSGKTHTMGTSSGGPAGAVIPRAVALLFDELAASGADDVALRVTFIEVLKEEVRDLLADASAPPLQLRDLPGGGAMAADARSRECASPADVASALARGGAMRATAATGMNAASSRSHAILTLHLSLRRGGVATAAKMHLVDLAGSERAKRTKAEGARLQEGIHINKGLLALGNVIAALGDDTRRRAGGHVPYRDSKLTRLLADALGGNSRTCMVACCSPADSSLEETLNTLKYANRARNIRNRVAANVEAPPPSAEEVSALRAALAAAKSQLAAYGRAGIKPGAAMLTQLVPSGGRALAEATARAERAEAAAASLRIMLASAEDSASAADAAALDAAVARDALALRLEAAARRDDDESPDSEQENTAPVPSVESGGVLRQQLATIATLQRRVRALTAQMLAAGLRPAAPAVPRVAREAAAAMDDAHPSLEDTAASEGDSGSASEGGPDADVGERTLAALAELAAARDGEFEERAAADAAELAALDAALEAAGAEDGDEEGGEPQSEEDAAEMRARYERVLEQMESEREALLGERERLLGALEAASSAPAAGTAPRSMASGNVRDEDARIKLRALEEKLAALQRKLKEAAAAEAARRAADERRRVDAAKSADDVVRLKAARVDLVRRMEREARAHADAKRAAAALLEAERRAGRRAAAALAAAAAAARRTEQVLRRKTEEVAAQQRTITQLKQRAADSRTPAARLLAFANQHLGLTSAAPPPLGSSPPASPGARQAWLDAQLAAPAPAGAARWAGVRSLEEATELLSMLFDAAAEARAAAAPRAGAPRVRAAGPRRAAATPAAAAPKPWDASVSGAGAAATSKRGLRAARPGFMLSPRGKLMSPGVRKLKLMRSGGGSAMPATAGASARRRRAAPPRWRAPTSDTEADSDSESAPAREDGAAATMGAAAAAAGEAMDAARARIGAAAAAAVGWALRAHATPVQARRRPPFVLGSPATGAVSPSSEDGSGAFGSAAEDGGSPASCDDAALATPARARPDAGVAGTPLADLLASVRSAKARAQSMLAARATPATPARTPLGELPVNAASDEAEASAGKPAAAVAESPAADIEMEAC